MFGRFLPSQTTVRREQPCWILRPISPSKRHQTHFKICHKFSLSQTQSSEMQYMFSLTSIVPYIENGLDFFTGPFFSSLLIHVWLCSFLKSSQNCKLRTRGKYTHLKSIPYRIRKVGRLKPINRNIFLIPTFLNFIKILKLFRPSHAWGKSKENQS